MADPEKEKTTNQWVRISLCGFGWRLLAGFWSISLVDISRAQPILQSFVLLTILSGAVFLKERERIWPKILGGVLAVVGVILVKGS